MGICNSFETSAVIRIESVGDSAASFDAREEFSMKPLLVGLLLISSVTATTPSLAKGPPNTSAAPDVTQQKDVTPLRDGNRAVMNTAVAAQTGRPTDPDQGDDNASDRAIQVVCSKSTPAAQRSAICRNVSPD
jgi:hypothetical protein